MTFAAAALIKQREVGAKSDPTGYCRARFRESAIEAGYLDAGIG
jgi:hypothetical protein